MTVSVIGTSAVPTYVSDMSLQLWPDRPVDVSWSTCAKLVDRRLARVVGYNDVSNFEQPPFLYWLSPFSQGDGYATAAESMAFWLMKSGMKLSVHHSWFLVKEGLRPEILQELDQPLNESCMVGLCMATPGEFAKLPTPAKIGFTMYEATDPLRIYPEWRHECNAVDALFVPSKFCKAVFSQFTRVPIKVVPLAINEGYCMPVKRKRRKKFRVVTFATLTGRKAPLEMIEVFQRAFPSETDVEFVLKTRLEMLGSKTSHLPEIADRRIKVLSGTWPREEIHNLLLASDCMLFLSKGEGFGMTPREAMATGLPTILADNSGMSDVCNSDFNWPVPTKHLERSPLGGEWSVPDWNNAVEQLRDIYDRPGRAYSKAFAGASWFINKHGPAQAAQGCVEAIQSLGSWEKRVEQRQSRLEKLPRFAELPSTVQTELALVLDGRRAVNVPSYDKLHRHNVKDCSVTLGQQLLSMTDEPLRFAINYLMTAGAYNVVIAVPSVFEAPGQWSVSRPWRMEHLQHVLKGLSVGTFRYIADHKWILVVVTRPGSGTMMRGFGSVIDGRWKPT